MGKMFDGRHLSTWCRYFINLHNSSGFDVHNISGFFQDLSDGGISMIFIILVQLDLSDVQYSGPAFMMVEIGLTLVLKIASTKVMVALLHNSYMGFHNSYI